MKTRVNGVHNLISLYEQEPKGGNPFFTMSAQDNNVCVLQLVSSYYTVLTEIRALTVRQTRNYGSNTSFEGKHK